MPKAVPSENTSENRDPTPVDEAPPTATLAAGLVAAQRAAKAVHKDSKNKFHGYNYASGEAVIAEAKEALSAGDLAFFMKGYSIRMLDGTACDMGGVEESATAVFPTYILVHASGEREEMPASPTPIMPEKGRPPDKALAAALTYNLAYTLRGLLMLPRVAEDKEPEPDNRQSDQDYVPPTRGRGQAAPKGGNGSGRTKEPARDTRGSESPEDAAQTEALERVKARLIALSQFHGADKCKAAVGDAPRKTVADMEAQAGLIEKALGAVPASFKPFIAATEKTFWEAAKKAGYNGTEPAFVEALGALFATQKLSELTPEQRTAFVAVLESPRGLLDAADGLRADVGMTFDKKPAELTGLEWRRILTDSGATEKEGAQ